MISLSTYLNPVKTNKFKLTPQEKKKLLGLDKLFWEIAQMYHKDKPRYVTNISEECSRFLESYKANIKYFPKLKYETNSKYETDGVIDKIDRLVFEFRNFNCFLSKYYIEVLMAYKQMIKGCINLDQNYHQLLKGLGIADKDRVAEILLDHETGTEIWCCGDTNHSYCR